LFPISRALEARLREVFPQAAPMLTGPLGHTGGHFALPDYDPQAAPSLLYVGSLHKWKGLETAFEASAGLGVPFDVVGDAGGLERCQAYCQEHGFTHVNFHGQVPPEQAGKFYTPGCICLLPLSNEEIARSFTSPLKIFEYMAAGRPIVAGDVPSICELLKDGEHARLAPVGDVAGWRRALEEMLRDRATASRLARNARLLARACTWDERAKPLVDKMLTLV
jgi:glycosyltransferase involved in cell wall biosynthesis